MSIGMPSGKVLRTLALDTSWPGTSVALLEGKEVRGELCLWSGATHSERLLPAIEYLLRGAGWALSDLHLVAAGLGPGSFTGIRIGVATAVGLAQSCAIPFVGLSGLEALAHAFPLGECRVGVILDAQRAQVYYAEFRRHRGRLVRLSGPVLLRATELKSVTRRSGLYLTGAGAEIYAGEIGLGSHNWPKLLSQDPFLAVAMGRLGLEKKRSWRRGAYLEAEPAYIRPPDALLKAKTGS